MSNVFLDNSIFEDVTKTLLETSATKHRLARRHVPEEWRYEITFPTIALFLQGQ
jgi:hypothetical protein